MKVATSKEEIMINKESLCDKIKELYPTIGECGIDIEAEYDNDENTWVIHLKKDNQNLKTYLEDGDAEKCMQGELCVGLGIEIAQLKANIERLSDTQPSEKDSVCTKAPEMAEHQRFMDSDEPCDDGRSGKI
jgi:hypothetical protein